MKYAFISYVHENEEEVAELCRDLRSHGIHVWLDREQIKPGERWRTAIRQAIQGGAFFIACFSNEYTTKNRSYMNEELTLAIDELRQRPTTRAWFIPVILSTGEVPDREIGGGDTLRDIQWIDLSLSWEDGVRRMAYIINQNDSTGSGSGLDLASQLRAAIAYRSESLLADLLQTAAREVINEAIQQFIRDQETDSYDYLFRPVCKLYGHQFTAGQIEQLVTRGGLGNSRTGFVGLDILYNEHFHYMKELCLPEVFSDNTVIGYYCKLREKFPDSPLHGILLKAPGELEIDGISVDTEYFFDKYPNRGNSAFLDAVFATNRELISYRYPEKRFRSFLHGDED